MQSAVSNDEALERALDEYRRWLNAEGAVPLPIELGALVSESHDLAADAFGEAIARANDLCERNASFEEAEEALRWQRRAESVLPESVLVQNGIDRPSVLVDLCVQVVIESTSFPQSPVVGEPALLEVVFGFAFGDGPTEFSPSMVAFVLANGASPAGSTEFTGVDGRVELTLTPESGSISIEVDACIGNGGFNGGRLVAGLVCQEALIVRGLVVEPSSVTLNPGVAQQFSAELLGVDEPVTWLATGGSIDENGFFTAGTAAGTFTVTATSVANPSLTATAQVNIEELTGEPMTSTWLGTAQCLDVDRLGDVKPSGIAVIQTGNQLEIRFPRTDPGTGDVTFQTPCVGDELVYTATLSGGGSFGGSTNDCHRGPCSISGTFDGSTISGRAVWQGVCVSTRCPAGCDCYTDFEATLTDSCVVLSSGGDPPRMSCNP